MGPACEALARAVAADQPTKQRAIGQLKSLLSLSAKYGAPVLEEASRRARAASAQCAPSVEAAALLCRAAYERHGDVVDSGEFAILRGPDYYGEE